MTCLFTQSHIFDHGLANMSPGFLLSVSSEFFSVHMPESLFSPSLPQKG